MPSWTCPSLPTPPPATNVRQLRPGNIKAVMAMGDSITAGFAMIGEPPTDLVEDRNYVCKNRITSYYFLIHSRSDFLGFFDWWSLRSFYSSKYLV